MSSLPSYPTRPPPAGLRIPAITSSPFPPLALQNTAPFQDLSGAPIYICSVLLGDKSICPGKCGPGLMPACRYPYGGSENAHEGRYDILPFTHEMEWVQARNGEIPRGRRPVEGGYEVNGEYLYHAAIVVVPETGLKVPGKTGAHLGAATCAYGNQEVVVREGYEILCWR